MMRLRPALSIFAATILVCAAVPCARVAFAQNGRTPPADQNTLDVPRETDFRDELRVVLAPTTVVDKDGNVVTGLKPSEFRLYDNDKVQNIKVDETFAPLSLVVAIQADAKVEAVIPKVQKIGNILTSLVAGEGGEVAIVAFDHRFQRLQDFTNDSDQIETALKQLKPGSSSNAMTDAVVESTRMLRARPKTSRKVLLLIAETRDNGSSMKMRDALTMLEVNNISVYALNISRLFTSLTAKPPLPRPSHIPPAARHVPGGGAQTPTSVAQMTGAPGYGVDFVPMLTEIYQSTKAVFVDNPVEVYTRYTGGKEYGFVSQRDLEQALSEISRDLHNQYLLTYSPNNKEDGGFHKIRVEVARPNVEVRTRDGYWLGSLR